MRRDWMRMLALVPVLSFLWGCSSDKTPGPTACATAADCPAGQGCVGGFCRAPCVTSDNCTNGQVCVSGYCLQPCDTDKDCPDGQQCKTGYCVATEHPDGGPTDGSGPTCIDKDHDGYGQGCTAGPDCNDNDPAIHPGAIEICDDGIDNDCDGKTDKDDTDCQCKTGDIKVCYTGPGGTEQKGICHQGLSTCGTDGFFGSCVGEQKPTEYPDEKTCDGLDNNCDGKTDEGLLNRCGKCSPPNDQLVEICGNGLDDNCDGRIDENCSCDPDCHCTDPGSGANCECHPPTHQPCYSGPPPTLGFGPCKGGFHDCQKQPDGSYAWTECVGEVLPSPECAGGVADGIDNNCDGVTDDGCLPDKDHDGYSPPEDCDDNDPNVHPGATEVCNGKDDNCNGLIDEGVANACGGCGSVPDEVCGDGLDNNCNGAIDEGCGGCTGSQTKPCYRGPPNTAGVGECKWGTMTCNGEFWSECSGDVLPRPEVCGETKDYNCDGKIGGPGTIGANSCGDCGGVEICDGKDNNCDGLTDEGLRNACGQCLTCTQDSDCPPGAIHCDPVLKKCLETACDGLDNNCDGLIDEGLLTACGTCPGIPCYHQDWNTPGDCVTDPQRKCDGVVPDDSNPDAITLGQGSVKTPFIYISVTGREMVAKLDTATGQKIWEVDSHGYDPSRTAVALDYSVWVGNRGFASPADPNYSNVVHLDADGNLICRADVTQIARSVAIDGDGNVWAGTWNTGVLYKISGSAVDTNQNPPRCQILGSINLVNPDGGVVNIYGLAVDGNGYVWTSSSPYTAKVNTATMTVVDYVSNPWWYGIAIDQNNNVWLGGWGNGGPVHRILGNPPYTLFATSVSNVTAVTVAPDGYVWGSSYGTNEVVKIDPNTGQAVCTQATQNGTNPHGVAVDANGKIWSPNRYGGYANRYLQDCTPDGSFPVDPGYELYTYSDMTGMQLRTITTRAGHWIQNFDSGYATPLWNSATWTATIPPNTAVSVSFVSADTEAGLVTAHSPVCGPFTSPPADLNSCAGLQRHRWLSADVLLSTTQDGFRPTFSDLQVFWSR